MLSSLLNYAHFQDNQSRLSLREADWYGTVHEPFPPCFMWGSNSCWNLDAVDGFLIFPSEAGCITCFDYAASFFSSEEDVSGGARGGGYADIEL